MVNCVICGEPATSINEHSDMHFNLISVCDHDLQYMDKRQSVAMTEKTEGKSLAQAVVESLAIARKLNSLATSAVV